MKAKAKGGRLSIRWKTLGLLGVFVVCMIGLLWIFQVLLLDNFYIGIRKNSVTRSMAEIEAALETDSYADELDKLATDNDLCISILAADGSKFYEKHVVPNCIVHTLSTKRLTEYYLSNVKEKGDVLEGVFSRDAIAAGTQREEPKPTPAPTPTESAAPQPGDAPLFEGTGDSTWKDDTKQSIFAKYGYVQSMMCIRQVQTAQGELLVMVNAGLTPVNATVDTLRAQLILITALLVLLALVLGLYLSARVSKPIISMSREAKKLAAGDFDVHFAGGSYREAAELAGTLNYAAQELSRTDELRSELMANISHDLRTPLTMIGGFAEMMRDLPSENTPENAQIIVDETRYLTALVNDILDLSRLEAGVTQISAEPFNLTQALRAMLNRYEKLSRQEGYRITVEAGRDAFVHGDALRLQQVIYNLINNAIAYTGADKSVRVRQVLENGKVRVEVSDTGKGIAEKDLPYIWDRYYKVDKKNHRRAVIGTGLGLSIVKKTLQAHGAEFGVNSSPAGSTFWFEMEECDDSQGTEQ